jgi:general secretion pathway protein G
MTEHRPVALIAASRRPELRGASLLEFMVVVVVAGILIAILLDRLAFYREAAEKVALQTTVLELKTAVRERVIELMLKQREADMAGMLDANPVPWLSYPLRDYRGEKPAPSWSDVPPGSWYFDTSSRELVYKRRSNRLLEREQVREDMLLRFRVTASQQSMPKEHGASGRGRVEGVTLAMQSPHTWLSADR